MDTKIKQLNKSQVQMLRKVIQKELDKIGDAHGMNIKLGNIRYDEISFRTKLEASVVESTSGRGFEQESFNAQCGFYDLKPEDYLKEVSLNSSKFRETARIYGFNSKASRYPVLLRTDSDRLIKSGIGILDQLK